MQKIMQIGTPLEKRELLKGYIKRLSEYQYLIQHPAFKHFIEKKMEIKKHISEVQHHNLVSSGGAGPSGAPGSVSALGNDVNPFEVADRFREIFGYLMEVPIQDSDYKIIDKFDQFIKAKLVELDLLRAELKAIHAKCVSEFRVEGKIYQKVTYQSFYYNLKMTAECLGIKNKDLMNIQSNPIH